MPNTDFFFLKKKNNNERAPGFALFALFYGSVPMLRQ